MKYTIAILALLSYTSAVDLASMAAADAQEMAAETARLD